LDLAALEQVLARKGAMMLATAGGIVAEPVTFELLRSSCFTVWVKAKPAEHMSRVREQGDLRPMADDKAGEAEAKTLRAEPGAALRARRRGGRHVERGCG